VQSGELPCAIVGLFGHLPRFRFAAARTAYITIEWCSAMRR
jgi:hypothetical protein